MPSFNPLADIVNQILIRASCAPGKEYWRAQVGSDSVSGGEAKDSCHLIFYPPRGARGEPSLRLIGTHELAGHGTKFSQEAV